jgi:superfamily II DNA or RNA helicase
VGRGGRGRGGRAGGAGARAAGGMSGRRARAGCCHLSHQSLPEPSPCHRLTRSLRSLCSLSLRDHSYVRLDGSTPVEERQRLMTRFNGDARLFCFILSTRSGGLGINLTGADSVVFYDSDWNPAMDAQAQDRAHRIGQTRDVHIYRLVSESTVEENILLKARQKRDLAVRRAGGDRGRAGGDRGRAGGHRGRRGSARIRTRA